MDGTTAGAVTLTEIAKALGITERVARRLAEKVPPAGRLGIIRYWRADAVEKFREVRDRERMGIREDCR
jgi:hypothetical protein